MSPIAAQKRKFDELIDEINSLRSGDDINEIEVGRCKIEAKKLKQRFPEQAFSALGMIACIEEEYGKMRQYHEKAIAISPGVPLFLSHYAASLGRAAYYDEAYDYAKKALRGDPDDFYALQLLTDVSKILDLQEEHSFYVKEFNKMSDEKYESISSFKEDEPEYLSRMLDCFEKECSDRDNLLKADKAEFNEMRRLAKEIEEAL
jgi:tetratricopeptide (TPR) repeat protein